MVEHRPFKPCVEGSSPSTLTTPRAAPPCPLSRDPETRNRTSAAAQTPYFRLPRTMSDLADKTCIPCRGGVPVLEGAELAALHDQLAPGWEVVDEHHLTKAFTFPDFVRALAFTNRIGGMAEQQAHHPDIHLAWGVVRVEIWTHKIDGLTESDFVFAAKAEKLYEPA